MQITSSQTPTGEVREDPRSAPLPEPTARSNITGHQLWNLPAVPASKSQTWWIHLWAGLARDPTGKHYKAMGNAVWLYLYLLVSANRSDGVVLRRMETIVLQTGFSERSVTRWLQELREKGYIISTSNGRSLRITITKWRPSRAAAKT